MKGVTGNLVPSLHRTLEVLATRFLCSKAFCERLDNVSVTILSFWSEFIISPFVSLLFGAVYTLIGLNETEDAPSSRRSATRFLHPAQENDSITIGHEEYEACTRC